MAAAGVFAVTGDDSQNLMVALSVKLLNHKARVVARLHDIRNANKARRAGADEIVSPDFTGGMRIASAMVRRTWSISWTRCCSATRDCGWKR